MLYASTKKIVPQVLSDLGLLAWIALWAFLAVTVRNFVLKFAVPAQKAKDTAQSAADSLSAASSSVSDIPFIGGALELPLTSLGMAAGTLVLSADQIINLIITTAIILAIIVFVVPIIIYLYKWLPWRFSFVKEATAGKKLIPATASPELFALRALAHAPMSELVKISDDPMGAWQRGDTDIITKLADLELRLDGLKLPRHKSIKTSLQTDPSIISPVESPTDR